MDQTELNKFGNRYAKAWSSDPDSVAAFYAEGGRTCLPNSKLCMGYETGKHDYAHPCRDVEQCYWLNWLYPVRVKSLEPDERIEMSFAEWRAGHDAVFERAEQLATAKQRITQIPVRAVARRPGEALSAGRAPQVGDRGSRSRRGRGAGRRPG